MNCPRCGGAMTCYSMSWMTLEHICCDCKDREATHPRYAEARAAELAAVEAGDWNYPGLFDNDRAAIADLYTKEKT